VNRLLSLLFLLCCSWLPWELRAHEPFESSAVARLIHGRLEVVLTFPQSMAEQLLPGAAGEDGNRETFAAALTARAPEFYEFEVDGVPLKPLRTTVRPMPDQEWEISLRFQQPPAGALRIRARYLEQLKGGYAGTVSVLDEEERSLGSKILNPFDTALDLSLPVAVATANSSGATAADSNALPSAPAPHPSFAEYLWLGVTHILTGYDHLLFLCALLVMTNRLSAVLVVISCFTLAHSLTLALAALDLVTVSSRLIEPLIAASIIFVAVENLLFLRRERNSKSPAPRRSRAVAAFGFGLIHGFGFASVLRETGLAAAGGSVALPLLSFNLGVELGQIGVAAVFVPLLSQGRKMPAFARYGPAVISGTIAIAGLVWLLQRTLF
jgi:hydrogenase/urease accessory protein HupE